MPIYEYQCRSCGRISEFLVGVGKDRAITCSHCGSPDMERVMSTPSVLGERTGPGTTCCGREERCDSPPCSAGEGCRRDIK